jgi:hypothetical protein
LNFDGGEAAPILVTVKTVYLGNIEQTQPVLAEFTDITLAEKIGIFDRSGFLIDL